MLKRLGAYPQQNGLALALREIGHIEKTLHALDWLELPALRRQATAELNKGESHNALCRAVCFHRPRAAARPHGPGSATPRQRPRPGFGCNHPMEHRLSWPRAGRRASPRRLDPRHAAHPPRPAQLAAHQPHGRLSLARRRQPRPGRVQAIAKSRAAFRSGCIAFMIHSAKRESSIRLMAYPQAGTATSRSKLADGSGSKTVTNAMDV